MKNLQKLSSVQQTKICFVEVNNKKIEDCKNGEFVRVKYRSSIYVKNSYCRINRAYQLDNVDDISECIYLKKGTIIHLV